MKIGQHLTRTINWKDMNLSFIVVIILVSPFISLSFKYRMVLNFIPGKPLMKSRRWWRSLNGSHGWSVIYRPDSNFNWYAHERKMMWTINLFYQGDFLQSRFKVPNYWSLKFLKSLNLKLRHLYMRRCYTVADLKSNWPKVSCQ